MNLVPASLRKPTHKDNPTEDFIPKVETLPPDPDTIASIQAVDVAHYKTYIQIVGHLDINSHSPHISQSPKNIKRTMW